MTHPNTVLPTIASGEVKQIFEEIMSRGGFTQEPQAICMGPPTWVIQTGRTARPQDQLAIRLRHDSDPEALLHQVRQQVDLVRKLRALGGRVVEFLHDPWIEPGQRDQPGGYVASVSRFLPGKATNYQYGAGIATLHDASSKLDLSEYDPMDPLFSISDTKAALRHVQEMHAKGTPLTTEQTVFGATDIENMERAFFEANHLRHKLFSLAIDNGSELVVVQEDVHLNNRGLSHDGVGTVLDIDPYVGPRSMDFGRVENDWKRFVMPYDEHGRTNLGQAIKIQLQMANCRQRMSAL
jgi:hypothetical protein